MRRQKDTESLVYAYGCGEPTVGWQEAQAENERCRMLWDRLVAVERSYEQEIETAARADVPALDVLLQAIAHLSGEIARSEGERKKALVVERRSARRETWPLLAAWRKAHPEQMREFEVRRRARVVDERHATLAYWCNYNAVIQRYDTARRAVREKGRRLRLTDIERDDGCLTVQIQRTRSGLGAAPRELQDGSVSALAIGVVPEAAHDEHTFRGERRRLCRTEVEMRVDAAGNTIRLPLWYHRQLPEDCRVKQVQLVWSRRGERYEYRLCLTISRPRRERAPHSSHHIAMLRIAIATERGALRVAEIIGTDLAMPERIELDRHWCSMMGRCEWLQGRITDDALPDRERIRARIELPGLRARLLGRRTEQYRLAALNLAMRYRRVVIESPALSEAAWADRGTDANALRHRACAHRLVAEIQHQGRKHGCEVEVVLAERVASAPVPPKVRRRRVNGLGERSDGQSVALAMLPAEPRD